MCARLGALCRAGGWRVVVQVSSTVHSVGHFDGTARSQVGALCLGGELPHGFSELLWASGP